MSIPQPAVSQLADYLRLLSRWNAAYSLTAVRDQASMVARHVLDSLSAAPFVIGPRVADIGSGAGLPGIPLAIALPELQVTLIESRRKPIQFLLHARANLNLKNVDVCEQRAEEFWPNNRFDTAIARAVATLPKLVSMSDHLCGVYGRIVALKGRKPVAEIQECVGSGFPLSTVYPVNVPGIQEARHIVILNRA